MVNRHTQACRHQYLTDDDNITGDCDCVSYPTGFNTQTVALPIIYSLELTPLCNSRCPGCSNVFIEDKHKRLPINAHQIPMHAEQWEYIFDLIAPYARHFNITGGESTLYPHFETVIQAIQQREISFTVFTNGRWVDSDFIIGLLQSTSQCTGLLISLHGASAEAHEQFTGIPGSFSETIKNIRRATEAGFRVSTNTVLTRHNLNQIEDIVQLSQRLGAEQAVFNRYIGQSIPGLDLLPHELTQAIRQIDDCSKTQGRAKMGTCVPSCFVTSSTTGCVAGEVFCTIDPWGNVRPCNHAPQIAGNLLQESLQRIWHSPVMKSWRNTIAYQCDSCNLFETCRGGCRADAVLKNLSHDPLIIGGNSGT